MDYTGTGSISVGGCSEYSFAVTIPASYEVGDILYEKKKAQKGILRKHCIKKVKTRNIYDAVLYVDTFNSIFGEADLITYAEAVILADAANRLSAQQLEDHILNCGN